MHKYKIALCIPTTESSDYIAVTLRKLTPEINLITEKTFQVTLVVCVNGINADLTADALASYQKKTLFDLIVLQSGSKGKNKAINAMVKYCKQYNYDILHFLDDDINVSAGSILANIRALIDSKDNTSIPTISGSNFYAKKHTFAYIAAQMPISKAIVQYFLQEVYMVPFSKNSDINLFLSGQSMCVWAEQCPTLPDDSSGIADDAFLSNYYALQNKPYEKASNIIKVESSIIYFYVPYSFEEWKSQQKRIMIGVERSFLYFHENYDYLQKLFMYRYSEFKKYRKNNRPISIKNRLLLIVFRHFQKIILKEAAKDFHSSTGVRWEQIKTCKPRVDVDL